MDAKQVLTQAWEAVEAAGVPENLQEIAFLKALELVANTAAAELPPRGDTPPPTGDDERTGDSDETRPDDDPEASFYQALSTSTGVPVERLENVVHLEDGVPRVALNSRQLPEGKKAAQILIAKIVLAARSVYLKEQEVAAASIRTECDHYGVADGNLATNIKSMNSIDGLIVTGEKTNIRIKVRRSFTDRFDTVLAELFKDDQADS